MTQYIRAGNDTIVSSENLYKKRGAVREIANNETGTVDPRKIDHIFIINPKSFHRKSEMDAVIAGIENVLRRFDGIRYQIHASLYPRDAIGVVNRYTRDMREHRPIRVYAVGGDGILFDCLNAVVGIEGAELAIVPYGRENAFIRAFGEGIEEQFRDIASQLSAVSVSTDIILCNGQYALNFCSIGLESMVIMHRSKLLKRVARFRNVYRTLERGINSYSVMICALGDINKNRLYYISADGKQYDGLYTTIHIANGPCCGIYMTPTGESLPDDGLLEYVTGYARSSFAAMRLLKDICYGRYHSRRYKGNATLTRRLIKEANIASDGILCVNLDGEVFYETSVNVGIIPGGALIVTPNGARYTRKE